MSAELAPQLPHRDTALMERLASGDLSALGELYDRHSEDVRRFVFRATGATDVADDVAHDAFLTLSRVAKRYDGQHSARSFLLGIAAKLVLRQRRGLAQRLRRLALFGSTARKAFEHTPEDGAAGREELEHFRAALERLSDSKRLVVLLADVEGLSGEQIAEAIDVPIGTVWTRLHYGRADLRKALARVTGHKEAGQ